jgi:hypothetical protein
VLWEGPSLPLTNIPPDAFGHLQSSGVAGTN